MFFCLDYLSAAKVAMYRCGFFNSKTIHFAKFLPNSGSKICGGFLFNSKISLLRPFNSKRIHFAKFLPNSGSKICGGFLFNSKISLKFFRYLFF